MGSLGDDNGQIKPSEVNPNTDFSHAETQPFDSDSQFSPPPFSGMSPLNVLLLVIYALDYLNFM